MIDIMDRSTQIIDRLESCIESEDGYWPTILAKQTKECISELQADNKLWKRHSEHLAEAATHKNIHYANMVSNVAELRKSADNYKIAICNALDAITQEGDAEAASVILQDALRFD